MADTRITKRGKANVDGIRGTIDLVVYPVAQSGKASQNWEEEIVKDASGFDAAWLARNHHYLNDFSFKLLGDTAAHAEGGAAFIAPLATVVLSAFEVAQFNGSYQNVSGAEIDLGNTKVGDFMLKFRRYADSAQNTTAISTPS
jgi:hypothetical protein